MGGSGSGRSNHAHVVIKSLLAVLCLNPLYMEEFLNVVCHFVRLIANLLKYILDLYGKYCLIYIPLICHFSSFCCIERLATLRNSDKPRHISEYRSDALQRSASHSHKRSSSVTSPLAAVIPDTRESVNESGSLKLSRQVMKSTSPPPIASSSTERLEYGHRYSNGREEPHSSNLKRRHSDKWRNRITPPPVTSPEYMTETTHFLNDSSYQYYGDAGNYSSLPRSIGRKAKKKHAETSLSPPLHTSTGQLNYMNNEGLGDRRDVMSEEDLFTPPNTNKVVHPELQHSGRHQRYHSEPNHLISQPHMIHRRKNSSPNPTLPPSILEEPAESSSPLRPKKHKTHKKDKHPKPKSPSSPIVDGKAHQQFSSNESRGSISENDQIDSITHRKPPDPAASNSTHSESGSPRHTGSLLASPKHFQQEADSRSTFKATSEVGFWHGMPACVALLGVVTLELVYGHTHERGLE